MIDYDDLETEPKSEIPTNIPRDSETILRIIDKMAIPPEDLESHIKLYFENPSLLFPDVISTYNVVTNQRLRATFNTKVVWGFNGKIRSGEFWEMHQDFNEPHISTTEKDGWIIENGKLRYKEIIPADQLIKLNPADFSIDVSQLVDEVYKGIHFRVNPKDLSLEFIKSGTSSTLEYHHIIPKNYITSIREDLISEGYVFGSLPYVNEFVNRTKSTIGSETLARQLSINWDIPTNCLPLDEESHNLFHDTETAQKSGFKWDNRMEVTNRILALNLMLLSYGIIEQQVRIEHNYYSKSVLIKPANAVIDDFTKRNPEITIDTLVLLSNSGIFSDQFALTALTTIMSVENVLNYMSKRFPQRPEEKLLSKFFEVISNPTPTASF